MPPSDSPPYDTDEPGAGTHLPSAAEASSLIERLPAIVYVSEAGVDGRWLYISGQVEQIDRTTGMVDATFSIAVNGTPGLAAAMTGGLQPPKPLSFVKTTRLR